MRIICSLIFFLSSFFCFAEAEDLKKAFEKDDPAYVDLLIKSGKGIHFKDSHDRTPLHNASEKGKLNIVKALINKGAKVNAKDMIDWTPLHYASWRGNLDVVQYLINNGAKVDAKGGKSAVSGYLYYHTPLHVASRNKHFDVVKILITAGADVNPKDYKNKTPLYYATSKGSIQIIKYLLSHGANPNIYLKNSKWPTPLFSAILKGYIPIAQLLIDNGADVFAKNKKGETPYDFVVRLKRNKEAEFLKKIMDEKKKEIEAGRVKKKEAAKRFIDRNKYIFGCIILLGLFFGFIKLRRNYLKTKHTRWICASCQTENTVEHLQCWKCGKSSPNEKVKN
jgi:ankyrin repeat protein